jgi:predicted permease
MAFSGPALTSVLQGGIRVNTYVGLATAATLLGNEGLTMAGLVHAIWVLTVNIICVAALVTYGKERVGSGGQLNRREQVRFGIVASSLVALGRNPMIVACCIGLFINAIGRDMPAWLASGLVILGQAGLPLGLLLVGAGLRVRNLSGAGRAVAVASLVKLILLPLVIWKLATILPIGLLGVAVLVLVASLPSATSSYVLALEMGGDAELMAGILTVETVLAALTMPIVLGVIGVS